ncbi:MAG: Gfo/Idh/MocA family oxidoreductase [Bacteroidetes bacterium]|nr:Gfo/Idh/MocA family oxidoreductase [Bacteroidota bacterium]
MSNNLKVGVIGVGHLGSLHAKMFSQNRDVDFVGIYDIDQVVSKKVAIANNVKNFSTLDELISEVDAANIVTITSEHFTIAKKLLDSGKHIFVEKPITQTPEEAQILIDLSKKNNLVLQVGHIERFNPAILALESYNLNPMFIESHRLAQFNPRGSDVAVVLDLMIHDLDIILSLIKSPVSRIDATGVSVVSKSVDIANARLQFENGAVANITASRISQNKMRKMRLFQEKEYISIDFILGLAEVFKITDDKATQPTTMLLGKIGEGAVERNIIYERPTVKEINPLQHELEQFVKSITEKIPVLVTGEDGKRALEVANEIIKKIGSSL